MPDITKCKGTNCDKRTSCYRYMSDPYHFRQSYFSESPMNKDSSCNYYWEIKNKDNDRHTETKSED
jgi:hypothetical protein